MMSKDKETEAYKSQPIRADIRLRKLLDGTLFHPF